MKRTNHFYVKLLAGVIVVLLLFTYIATQVYRQSLPIVETEEIFSGTVKRTYMMEGGFSYAATQEIILPVPVIVEKVYVRAGESVGEGMKLLKLDMQYLEVELLKLELEIEKMLDREADIEEERERQIFAYEREKKEQALGVLREAYEADGFFYAKGKGEVRAVCSETGTMQAADKLLISVCDKTGNAEISWVMQEEGIVFERFFADIRVTDGHNINTTTIVIEDGIKKNYDMKTGKVYYTARVEAMDELWAMHDAEAVKVMAYYISDVYPALIPVSAVSYESDGTAFVYEVKNRAKSFGMEYYVKKQIITILDSDNSYVATGGNLRDADIVVNSSKELTDRGAVWLEVYE